MLHCHTAQQRLLTESIGRFSRSEVPAPALVWDEQERFCHEAIGPLAELGVLGATVPEKFGGAGLGAYDFAIIIEQLAAADGSLALTVASHVGLCCSHIVRAGTEAQKQHYLPKLATGEWIGAWGLTEPDSGSDVAAMVTRAERVPGGYRLHGSKIFITQGSVADVYVVMAVTAPDLGARGISAFVLERGQPGFSVTPLKGKHGMRGSDTAVLHFDDVFVPEGQLLGTEGGAFADTMQVLDRGRITIAALACGLAAGSLEAALAYTHVRRQFQKPVSDFQGVQFQLADMATDLAAAEGLLTRAAMRADGGKSFGKEASMAKLFASEAAVRICGQAVQLHGGNGYVKEYRVERHLRDARLCTIGEGTSEIQRMVIFRHLRREYNQAAQG